MMNPSVFGFTGPDVRPGDWYCSVGNCGAHNFASRSSCFKCGVFKDDLASSGGGFHGDLSRNRNFGFGGGSVGVGGGIKAAAAGALQQARSSPNLQALLAGGSSSAPGSPSGAGAWAFGAHEAPGSGGRLR